MITTYLGKTASQASFQIVKKTDTIILLQDIGNNSRTITNDDDKVINVLSQHFNLKNKRVFYKDSDGRFDELVHESNQFSGFSPCSSTQQDFLNLYSLFNVSQRH